MRAEQIKQNVSVVEVLERYLPVQLSMKGTKSRNIPCPIHNGIDDNFGVDIERNIATCFSQCSKTWNVIDLTMEIHNINFKEAISLLEKDFNLQVTNIPSITNTRPSNRRKTKKVVSTATHTTNRKYSHFYNTLTHDNYFLNRNLSLEIIEKYKLGAVTHATDLTVFDEREQYGLQFHRFIIPITDRFFIARLDEKNADGPKYRNFGNPELLNKHYVGDLSQMFVFVTEGAIDALTIESLGYHAIALNSASNSSLLVKEIQLNEEKARQQQFILLADNDEAGAKLEEKLHKSFKEMNMSIYVHKWYKDIPNVKDINELASKDINQVVELLEWAFNECINGNSAFHVLMDFYNEMNPIMPIQIKKFPILNEVIGGLRSGLYTIGAASSIGKTTFVQEIADDVAAQSEHVLYFTLEMSKKELLAKSLVRTMGEVKKIMKQKGEITYTRDLLNGFIKDHNLFVIAMGKYEKTAKNLFYHEGVFDISVLIIRQEVEKHIRLHNKKPLVIVDYLQILQPISDRMSEKQTTDKNVTELKRLARDCDVPVIAISSFNRDSYNRESSFSSFKESGAIEYGSDVVLTLELQKIKELDRSADGKVKELAALELAKGSLVRDINLKVLKNRFGKAFEEIEYSYMTSLNTFTEKVVRDYTEKANRKRI
ncbi:DnaB-like helicase C-terminal domain-containing protein [Lysinibacillus endophyticus]|uniref:DnaB-like helicase C-terminal domain-containing protein n=1 Tax=Ureibacillus endophyticus TaxID=1978490 RepID=UPI00209FC605|nr:DnaB-like helicase C-terminal domain-containing protein [Lysinibacillus endophyticus]MCP1144867.1 toprim domain-containing protein [Lysinibacillus endophyticus]